jgi:DNA-binding CsgD family transcriptional regulator
MKSYRDLLEISLAPDEGSFERQLIAWCDAEGFERYNATLRIADSTGRRPVSKVVENMPLALTIQARQVGSDMAERDPCLRRLADPWPFFSSRRMYFDAGAADLWDLMSPYGYAAGVNTSVRLKSGAIFYLSFDRTEELEPSDPGSFELLARTQLLATYASCAAERLFLGDVQPANWLESPLSPRELDVLRWCMEGKSSATIGELLAISENTVSFHLKSATRKLGAANRTGAVVRAMRLGLIV